MINIDHLKSEDTRDPELDLAVSVGIRHIGIATYSSGKIYDYLVRKGHEPNIARTAVNELIRREYIDDMRAGRKVLFARTGRKQESRALLYKRLLQAGIAEDKADSIIHQTRDDNETCLELIKATYPVIPDFDEVPESDFYESAMKICARRGYTPNVSRRAITAYLNSLL